MPLATIEEAIEDYRQGKFVIIIDDKNRENEGDLCIAAEKITADSINFMATHGRGLICAPLTGQRLDELRIPLMVSNNDTMYGTAFTVSVESRHGVASGISASDRATTVKALVDPKTTPSDLIMPGHTFPLRACDGGVLVRAGHTEASIDLAKLAGLYPGAVVCEIMDEDGTMMRLPQLEEFAAKHGIKIISIADLIEYRYRTESIAQQVARSRIPTEYGEFTALAYESTADWQEGIALVAGTITPDEPVLVRVHSQCATGDALGSLRCDCGMQLRLAMQKVQEEGTGIILYLNQEGRGIGLMNKMRAYELQDEGLDTVEANHHLGLGADQRNYGFGCQVLKDLGASKVRLLTNSPIKAASLSIYGLELVERVPLTVPPNDENLRYLQTKRDRLGHDLTFIDTDTG
ncbi:MAG: bifunctional 3,4-dihydroxy-2-butanone-4-phosphate synthase/GTP cyclohydrolase II [Chloroflexota bacterium]|nr:bifunctional 3,4-dihydroxy-2-butanone-4-phosphate synthase/GTP cyclohydrolase II [Chloroflexota bacterium]MDE2841172.1 bifunctional 3,4-dihydroxy-2-butanone-4-phosphate synthase/GTP cyclohydrolase II [Chloroflexota bacterium]MDE2931407.1 bifunctional 3,4-dihydroxy-2-butanone-4-phosphate synthase/GTP cyclohydrolase II [Chloroflexota bacterium]